MNIQKLCDGIIRWGFYFLAILVPLILTPWNYELFEYNKMVVTYVFTAIIVTAWFVKMFDQKRLYITKTPLDIPLGIFLISQLISSIFSIDPHVSWFGYYSRFNGGMWSVISYILLYYAFVSNFIAPKTPQIESRIMNHELRKKAKTFTSLPLIRDSDFLIRKFLIIILATGTVVALYGLLERMGIDKNIWVQDVQTRVFSTLGQPNWLAAYLVALIPLSMVFVITPFLNFRSLDNKQISENVKLLADFFHRPSAVISLLITLLFFFVVICTRSRSGLVGLAIADVLFWAVTFLKTNNKSRLMLPFGLIHGVFFIVVFFNGSYIPQVDKFLTLQAWSTRLAPKTVIQTPPAPPAPKPSGTLLEYGGTESGTIRKYVWEAAFKAWIATPKNILIGTGTETFAWTFFQYRPVGHNLVSEWDFLYNKAHNEYLNYLATTGIVGLLSYLLILLTVIFIFIKQLLFSNYLISKQSSNSKTQLDQLGKLEKSDINRYFSFALFAGWISILVTNFFGFSVVITQIFLFLFPAIIYSLTSQNNSSFEIKTSGWFGKTGSIISPFIGITIVIILFLYWYADTLYAKGYRLSRSGLSAQAKQYLEDAIAINSIEPNYHDELANVLSAITYQMIENNDSTGVQDTAKKSINENDLALKISPGNVNFWKTRTKILYSLGAFDPKFNQMAIESLTHALSLSPNDPKIVYNLGILYGRENDAPKAIALMEQAKTIKPNYRDAYFGLFVMYSEAKDTKKANAELNEYLTRVDPNDQEFKSRLIK
jgi:putative inorganic carbon (hco3(-)) transporter